MKNNDIDKSVRIETSISISGIDLTTVANGVDVPINLLCGGKQFAKKVLEMYFLLVSGNIVDTLEAEGFFEQIKE